jgi:hypothetical protein
MSHRLEKKLNPDFPLEPSFPRRRESSKKNSPRSGQRTKVDPLRRRFSMNWIPAFTGMTAFFSNGKSRLKAIWQEYLFTNSR